MDRSGYGPEDEEPAEIRMSKALRRKQRAEDYLRGGRLPRRALWREASMREEIKRAQMVIDELRSSSVAATESNVHKKKRNSMVSTTVVGPAPNSWIARALGIRPKVRGSEKRRVEERQKAGEKKGEIGEDENEMEIDTEKGLLKPASASMPTLVGLDMEESLAIVTNGS